MSTLRPDAATIAHLTETYDLGPPDGTLTLSARGAMGRIWRLDLAGRTFAVKELFDQHEESPVRAEVAFTAAAADVGIGVPENLPTVDGDYLHQLPDRLGGAQVRVSSWVSGRTVRPDDPGRAEWLGQTLGRLHALRCPVDGIELDPWYETCPTPDRWPELIDAGAAAGYAWAGRLRTLLPDLLRLGSVITSTDPTAVIRCHRDPQPNNVLFDPSTGRYTLLDWENSGPSIPVREFAGALVEWHVQDGVVDVEAVRTAARAYRSAGGTDVPTELADCTVTIATQLNYLDVLASQTLDRELPPSEWQYATAGMDAALAGLPTIQTLTTVCQASRSS